ncbi:glycosyltransferase [Turicibacter sanguinis]|uniref:glycosyltransferase n=1 Tax=Turicibacter sanguinis TaxID=154288 RepID=UPI00189A0716|nr:glycosyltransferase [Turicibacter sanguinis]
MAKVSVIVPIYNTSSFLNKCLNSLVHQTLDDIEIICVNDGSTDHSQQIIDDFLLKYPYRIKSILKSNGGLSDARNVGLREATGDYIAFLDSDDYVEKDLYEKMYSKALRTNADIIVCGFKRITLEGEVLSVEQIRLREYYSSIDALTSIAPAAWNKLYKRELWIYSDVKYPKGVWYEDLPTTIKLMLYANNIATINEPLIYYVQHPNSISYTFDERAHDIFNVLTDIYNFYEDAKKNENLLYTTEEWMRIGKCIEALSLIHLIFAHLFRATSLEGANVKEEIKRVKTYLNDYFPNWFFNYEIYKSLSPIKKICVAIGLSLFKLNLFEMLLWIYKHVNRIYAIQNKW